MLDSIEHVPNPARFISLAASYVATGGVLLIDTCPLFYSKVGHHLFNHLPGDRFPWAHLRHDFWKLVEEHKVDPWSWKRYEELNKVTHDFVRRSMERSGLIVVQEHRSKPTDDETRLLDEHRQFLNLNGIDEALLFEDWLLLVGLRQP